jgi:hypothetical protein
MITLTTSLYSKIPGLQDYSSLQAGGQISIEVSESENHETIKERIRNIYTLLESTIKEELAKLKGNAQNSITAPAAFISAVQKAEKNPITTQPDKEEKTTAPKKFKKTGSNNSSFRKPENNNNKFNNHDRGKDRASTTQQNKAIYAIRKSKGIPEDFVNDLVRDSYHTDDTRKLTKSQASELIQILQNMEVK